jgi:hypothetical protein
MTPFHHSRRPWLLRVCACVGDVLFAAPTAVVAVGCNVAASRAGCRELQRSCRRLLELTRFVY